MGATSIRRSGTRRAPGSRKRVTARTPKAGRKVGTGKAAAHKAGGKQPAVPVPPVQYRFCKPGWAVLVEKQPSQQGTRFVCPFCTLSHRVSGPVRGFRKMRRAQWTKLRRVDE